MSDYQGLEELILMEEAVNYNMWITSLCKPYIKGDLLEIGSGIGSFTSKWFEIADSIVALEIAANCIKIFKERYGSENRITVIEKDITDLSEDLIERYDTVVSINVFEHIENDFKAFSNVFKVLKPQGNFICFVPAFQKLYGKTDRAVGHYRRYNREELLEKLNRAGFLIKEVRYINIIGYFAWSLTGNKKTVLSRKNIIFYDRFIIPFLKQIESVIKVPVGQSLLVIASKT